MKFQLSWLYIDGMSQQNIHVEAKELHFNMVCNMMILLGVSIFKTAPQIFLRAFSGAGMIAPVS
jgi:hypothetical protein